MLKYEADVESAVQVPTRDWAFFLLHTVLGMIVFNHNVDGLHNYG